MSDLDRPPSPVPPTRVRELDLDKPNAARMYDYYLGGVHNFEPDRLLADKALQVAPWLKDLARLNRAWLRRAVLFMMDQGIRQFLDLGSGIPTAGNVHETAHQVDPEARVVYVDYESVAVHHAHTLLGEQNVPGVGVVWADIREPRSVLDHDEVARLIDFDQPVGLLIAGLMLFIADDYDPAGLVAAYREKCAPGSYLGLSTQTNERADEETAADLAAVLRLYEAADEQMYPRDHATVESWFAGTELVSPGLVLLHEWRPEPDLPEVTTPARLLGYGGVGRVL
ncbi:MAG: SAM-dependent methyltransferase [Actinophytocola sp.]|uniref:SAM-dependent methyltransferase n=1 Tax=Actinophytocola sp. TaxID=1872138 RepID=UPI003D6C0D39